MESSSKNILNKYSSQIENSIKKFVRVTAVKGQVDLISSKIGGKSILAQEHGISVRF